MKIKKLRRDILAVAGLSVLGLLPLLYISFIRTRKPETASRALNIRAAEMSPDGLYVASLQSPGAGASPFVKYDLVVRRLGANEDIVRQPLHEQFSDVKWNNAGNAIIISGSGAQMLDFRGGSTPSPETWGSGSKKYTRDTLVLRTIHELSSAGWGRDAWMMPDSDFMINRNSGGAWAAKQLSTNSPVPVYFNLDKEMGAEQGFQRNLAPRPLNGTTPFSIEMASAAPEPTPIPAATPTPVPTATPSPIQRDFLQKEKQMGDEVSRIVETLQAEEPPSDEEAKRLEKRANEINDSLKKERARLFPVSQADLLSQNKRPLPVSYSLVSLRDISSGKVRWKRRLCASPMGLNLLWSPDGALLVAIGTCAAVPDSTKPGTYMGGIEVLDGRNGRTVASWIVDDLMDEDNIRFCSPKPGSWQLMVSVLIPKGRELRYFDARTGKQVSSTPMSSQITNKFFQHQLVTNSRGQSWALAKPEGDNFTWETRAANQLTADEEK